MAGLQDEGKEHYSLDAESFEEGESLLRGVEGHQHGKRSSSSRMMRLGQILTAVNLVTLVVLVTLIVHNWLLQSDFARCQCSEMSLNTYSPIFDRLVVQTSTKHFNFTFWPDSTHDHSIFQQAPSPEVDEAWARISDTHAFRLTHEEVIKMGKDPATLWPWPATTTSSSSSSSSSSSAEPEYMGLVDFFHQAHCLNHMRRAAFPEYYNMSATRDHFADSAFPLDDHLLHCQYIILEALMCHADLEVVTFNKIRGIEGPFARFAVDRQCRDIDALLAWKEANEVVDVPGGWEKFNSETPEGIVELEPYDVKTS